MKHQRPSDSPGILKLRISSISDGHRKRSADARAEIDNSNQGFGCSSNDQVFDPTRQGNACLSKIDVRLLIAFDEPILLNGVVADGARISLKLSPQVSHLIEAGDCS
jgi:hypothetical protein